MKLNRKFILFLTAIIIFFAAILVFVFSANLHHLDSYKSEILAAAEKSFGREVKYKEGRFGLTFGPTFSFTGVTIMERDGAGPFITAETLSFKVAVWPLLRKRIVLREVKLVQPTIKLLRDKDGKFNFSDILERQKGDSSLRIGRIAVSQGKAYITDKAVSAEGVNISLHKVALYLNKSRFGSNSALKLSAEMYEAGKKSTFSMVGNARIPAKGNTFTETLLDVKINAENIETGKFWDYYSKYVPFERITGAANIDSKFKGKITEFASSGTIQLEKLYFSYPQIFHSRLTPRDLLVKYDMTLNRDDIIVKRLALNVDSLAVKGSCSLKDIRSGNLFISAKATTGPFRLEEFGKYIPYGVIPDGPSKFIEDHIKGGLYRLQEGKLEGRISQIAHMERGTNYSVLFIKGTVENGLVAFGTKVPSFNSIRGNLALKGKDFILSGMEGSFGYSPFKLEGRITDYPLNKPSSYPFKMSMIPAPPEVSWILGDWQGSKTAFGGQSTLHLSGSGSSSDYLLSGSWDLTDTSYKYGNLVNKTKQHKNHLSFKGSINKNEAKILSLQYIFDSLSLTVTGSYLLSGEGELAFQVGTNQFQVQDFASISPILEKYHPRGRFKTTFQGKLVPSRSDTAVVSGEAMLAGVSIHKGPRLIDNINGNLRFTADSILTSMLSFRLGTSSVHAAGSLSGRKSPVLDVNFSSPAVDFADIGFKVKPGIFKAGNIRGNISLNDKNLKIRSFSTQLNKSTLNINGSIENLDKPLVDLSVYSPYLEIEDLLSIKELEYSPSEKAGSSASVRLALHANSGMFKNVKFSKLKAVMNLEGSKLHFHPLEVNTLGGSLSAKGTADFSDAQKPQYDLIFDAKSLSASNLMHSFQAKREITGSLSIHGNLKAMGADLDQLKKSALGNVTLECKEGSLRKFNVLSKIFSILNVSQILKFQLPDMVSGGMPYNKVTGNFSMASGILETKDLFIDSDAMNISIIGKMDVTKEELDLTVGVKPLQTVDKIVSRIPIVGWVLTGEKKSLITAYFEAKGSWENPRVTAIPVKSLAKGIFSIFKRVFQLPAKLITNTGEVVIGI